MKFRDLYKEFKAIVPDGQKLPVYWRPIDDQCGSMEVIIESGSRHAVRLMDELSYLVRNELYLPYYIHWEYQVGSGLIHASEYKLFLTFNNVYYQKQVHGFSIVEEVYENTILLKEEDAVYNFVRAIHDKGSTLKAEWEGGDDSRFVRILKDGQPFANRNRRVEDLADMIQSEIGIPGTGDVNNNGWGNIYSDDQCVYIVTHFLNFLRYPEPEPEVLFPELRWEFPGLSSYCDKLKRSVLNASIELYPDDPPIKGFRMQIRNGDHWKLSSKDEEYLNTFLDNEAEKLKYLFSIDIGEYEIRELTVQVSINHSLVSKVSFKPSFIKILKIAKEEMYILVEKGQSYE